MIRYDIPLADLLAAIDAESPNWRTRAAERTKLFRDLGKYAEEWTDPAGTKHNLEPFWSEVKPVYMRFQRNKCIYCETRLEGQQSGVIQWDLEHFRPKGNVRRWPHANGPHHYDFGTGDAHPSGYYLLAYHPGNYAAACKTCNSPYKSDYFPIRAVRVSGKEHPADYTAEDAFLVYPIGSDDADPEDLIAFDGAEAIPLHPTDPVEGTRARIIIDFLGLNRDALQYGRAWHLRYNVWPNYRMAMDGDADALKILDIFKSKRAPYTNCVRCFVALCDTDRAEAEKHLPIFENIIERFG